MSFKVAGNFHPTIRTAGNLDEARAWFQRVFGRVSRGPPKSFLTAGFPDDYCFTTMIQDVLLDTLDPTRLPAWLSPASDAAVEPHLNMLAFYIDDHDAFVRACHREGVRLLDLSGQLIEGNQAPPPAETGILSFADPAQMGFEYEFLTVDGTPKRELWAREIDPRFDPAWCRPVTSPEDPLRIECCAWHSLITDNPARLRRLFVDLLGGTVIHEGPNEATGTESTYVALSDAVYELAHPIRHGIASHSLGRHLRGIEDCYLGITFKTSDLQQVRSHLVAERVPLALDQEDMVLTEAKGSLGVCWGFTSRLAPGDPRTC